MPSTWLDALRLYSYSVTFTEFNDAHRYPGWFSFDLTSGDRSQTIDFESHFKKHAKSNIEPWLEVVFWKLYSNGKYRRNTKTCEVAQRIKNINPEDIYGDCMTYMGSGNSKKAKDHFKRFQKLFFPSEAIATVATFPAFLDPKSYPMVDTRIARWVGKYMVSHNEADPAGPQLIRPRYLDHCPKQTVLMMTDYDFMRSWICWCAHTANKLTSRKSLNGGWRARDVEMAVFTAWGKQLHLNPLRSG